jgi:hypothetical protein
MFNSMIEMGGYAVLIPQSRPNLARIQETDQIYKMLLEINKFTRE